MLTTLKPRLRSFCNKRRTNGLQMVLLHAKQLTEGHQHVLDVIETLTSVPIMTNDCEPFLEAIELDYIGDHG